MIAPLRLGFSATLIALLLTACGQAPEAPVAELLRPVLTTDVTLATSQTIGPFVGSVEPRHETTLSFQSAGRVLTRDVGLGDSVTKGQILATLDASVQAFQVETAQANLASAQAQFNNLSAAEARVRQLVSTNTAAQAQLDAATTARQTAQAQLDQAQANVTRAQDQLGYAQIVADADGVVVSTGAEVGQVVSAGQTVLTMARPDQRDAVFDLPDSLAAKLKVGDAIAVATTDAIGVQTNGIVREIAPSASATARLRRVRLTLDATSTAFRLGTTVEAVVTRPLDQPLAEIPLTAVLGDGDAAKVWVLDSKAGTVATRPVTIASRTASTAAISAGLAEGDRVVTAGINSLSEGQQVLVSEGNPE